MAVKAKANKEAMLDKETWLEMLYQLFNENEIRKIAQVIQPQIQGFSAKNSVKAPIAMLRKKTIEKLKQNKNIYTWMTKWYESAAAKEKDAKIDFEEFCHKSKMGDTVTVAEAVALAGILFPDVFNEHKDKILENIDGKKHPLEDLGTKKLAPKRQLQVKALAWEDSSAKEGFRLLLESTLDIKVELPKSLKDWIQEKNSVDIGEIAYLATTRMDEINKWTEGEKAVFLQMAFHDSQKVVWKMIDDLIKEKQQLENEDKAKERRLKKLEKLNAEREEIETALKRQISELEKKIADAESHYEKTFTELQMEIDNLGQQQTSHEQVATARSLDDSMLVTESDFMLITSFPQEELISMLPTNQIMTIQQPQDLHGLELGADINYIFVHSDGFSSKEQFQLDEIIEAYGLPYRSVSGNSAAITRQLIYYLEGAMINETNS
jgi:hypothetical protein